MNILIIGSGAREHAIAAALSRSPQKPFIFCFAAAVNPAIAQLTLQYTVGHITDSENIVTNAKNWQIDLTIIGPEAPLESGVADALWEAGIKTIGPTRTLARIETSKAFARELMQEFQIEGLPRYRVFTEMTGISDFLNILGEAHYVIKANGLMGGKGVKVAGEHLPSITEALQYCEEIFAQSSSVVIEEKLVGQEFSLMCFCDGETLIPMPIVQDHKRAYVGDEGPNTGGMGSYSDANHRLPFLTNDDIEQALAINQAVIAALKTKTGEAYIGVLYGGFMATRDGVYVIEFNARFGDPESLNVLTILQTDFVTICQAMTSQTLSQCAIQFAPLATVCKYAVPKGYPDQPVKNKAIDFANVNNKEQLYLAAVDVKKEQLIATGSRTVAYVGTASTLTQAEKIAEHEICAVTGELFHREDIGNDALIQKRIDHMKSVRAS